MIACVEVNNIEEIDSLLHKCNFKVIDVWHQRRYKDPILRTL